MRPEMHAGFLLRVQDRPSMLDSKVVADLQALEHLYEEWKALAAASALPLMAPGWSLAWWRHHAPPQALVRAVEVRDGATLVGLAPFFAVPPRRGHRVAYRLLGCGSGAPIAPLALPGREWKVAK